MHAASGLEATPAGNPTRNGHAALPRSFTPVNERKRVALFGIAVNWGAAASGVIPVKTLSPGKSSSRAEFLGKEGTSLVAPLGAEQQRRASLHGGLCQKYAIIFLTNMNTIANKILARAKRHGAGWVFSAKHLSNLGDRAAIDQALSRLARDGRIRRLTRGLYDVPKVHPVMGPLSPSPDAVALAAAEKAGHRLQISPARAANVFGLSSQVPAQAVYLTDGSSRRIKIGNQVVYLKHAGPRALLGAGTQAGAALQALRAIGKDHVNDSVVQQLRSALPSDAKNGLRELMQQAPRWTAPVIAAITA